MKTKYSILLFGMGFALMSASCAKHDLIDEQVIVGQEVPTCYWEVGSTTCKAGESFSFQGKYTVGYDNASPDHSEIWYRVNRSDVASASVALAGSTMSYNKSVSAVDTMRTFTPIVTYAHSLAEWDGHEFIIKGEVPVSRTLSPVTWKEVAVFDQDKFDAYYPAGFQKEFTAEVVDLLTKDSTYYNALRTVYINYPFTNAQFAEVNTKYGVNLPANFDESDPGKATSDKSDAWFSTSVADEKAVTGYYYITVSNNVAYYHEIAKDLPQPAEDGSLMYEGNRCYPVYKSAEWIFCRYDDNTGAIISTVRSQYMPAFKDLLSQITFPEWIFDSAEKVYRVDFSRKYSLSAQFRVYDSNGEEGIAYDVREININ